MPMQQAVTLPTTTVPTPGSFLCRSVVVRFLVVLGQPCATFLVWFRDMQDRIFHLAILVPESIFSRRSGDKCAAHSCVGGQTALKQCGAEGAACVCQGRHPGRPLWGVTEAPNLVPGESL